MKESQAYRLWQTSPVRIESYLPVKTVQADNSFHKTSLYVMMKLINFFINEKMFFLESQDPVKDFDFLRITIQYEMHCTNILQEEARMDQKT